MMPSRYRHLLALALALATWSPEAVRDVIWDRAVHHGVSAQQLIALASCETGGTFDPSLIGTQGEVSVFQLHPQGLGRHARQVGYDDPTDTWQAADYTARVFSGEWAWQGVGPSAWTCAQ